MPSDEYSFRTMAPEVLSLTWPALVGFAGAQALLIRRISALPRTSRTPLVVASTVATISVLAIGSDIWSQRGNEYWPYYKDFLVWIAWPAFVAFGCAQVLQVVFANAPSRGVLISLAAVCGTTGSFAIAMWFYVTPHQKATIDVSLRHLWLIGILSSTAGFGISTAIWLLARQIRRTLS